MRDIDKELLVKEICRVTDEEAVELELSYDYIIDLFKHWHIKEYTDHFYDDDRYNRKEQLYHNNWIDVWGRGIWGESQERINQRVLSIFISILEEDNDKEYRLWTFDMNGYRYIYYYNRDRFSDNWFLFKHK